MKIGYAWLGIGMTLLAAGAAQADARYRDGEFAGQPADTQWGAVQVRAIIRGGSLTSVEFLQYPSHRRRSLQISSYALPQLRDEAIRSQSARVDGVSGATLTAEGFQESLAGALGQAR